MSTQASRIRLSPGYRPNPTTILGVVFVALVFVWLIVNLVKTPSEFYNLLLIGITNGAVYGLIALGYSLVYGILELINFAHGDVFMLGGMLVATMTASFGLAGEGDLVLWGGILAMLADHDGVLRGDQHDDRARRLQAPAQCPSAGAADHRDRDVVHPPEHRPRLEGRTADLRRLDPSARRDLLDRRRRLHLEQVHRRSSSPSPSCSR